MPRLLLAGALAFIPALAWGLASPTTGLVWLIGCAIGWLLVLSRLSFSGAFRRLILARDSEAFAPILLLLVALVLGSGLLLSLEAPLQLQLTLSKAPITVSFLVGAFLFGLGMQLAGRCGSGTLASAERPDAGFALTLAGLVLGVFAASLQRPQLERLLPIGLPPISLLDAWPLWTAVLLQLLVLALLVWGLWLWCGRAPALPAGRRVPLLALAGAMLLVLLVSGEPWKVLWGLGLTGAHAARSFGWNPADSVFWSAPARLQLLAGPGQWLRHEAVVVDLAVIAGAFAAGQWRRAGAVASTPPGAVLAKSASGGLLMGFGGFLSYGCNISSFLGGVMSFSLHAWIWLLAALAGSGFWLALERRWRREQV